MRLFLAVNVPEGIRAEIENVQRDMKRARADVKWVAVENLHLTLKFLGETGENTVAPIVENVARALSGFGVFEAAFSGSGAFPSAENPRVVWVGLGEGAEKFIKLAEKTESSLIPLGFEKEQRGFTPHLTLGRTKSSQGREELAEKIRGNLKFVSGSFKIDHVDLMKSVLTPQGPEYTCENSISIL